MISSSNSVVYFHKKMSSANSMSNIIYRKTTKELLGNVISSVPKNCALHNWGLLEIFSVSGSETCLCEMQHFVVSHLRFTFSDLKIEISTWKQTITPNEIPSILSCKYLSIAEIWKGNNSILRNTK